MIAAALQLTVQAAGRVVRPVLGLAADLAFGPEDDALPEGYVSPTTGRPVR